jgi:hypothetical protein
MTQQTQIQPSQKSLEKGRSAVEYSQNLINMSLQQLWNIAYTSGYEDAMSAKDSQPVDASLQ